MTAPYGQYPSPPAKPGGTKTVLIVVGAVAAGLVLTCGTFGVMGALSPSSPDPAASPPAVAAAAAEPSPEALPSPSPSPSPSPTRVAPKPARWALVNYTIEKKPAGFDCVIILGCSSYPDSVSGSVEVRNVGGSEAYSLSVYFNVMKGRRVVYSGSEEAAGSVMPGQSIGVDFDSYQEWTGGPYRVVLRAKSPGEY